MKHRIYLLAFISAYALSFQVIAQEFKPYPRADITVAQWLTYFNEVREKHGTTVQDLDDEKLLVYTDKTTTTIYGFTKPGHPAHPAWITRKPEQRGDSLFIGQIGYFAGSEPPFAKLFRDYLALNERLTEDIKLRSQQVEKK